MQVFAVDISPTVCAYTLDDRRVNKMILETSQLLAGATYNKCIGNISTRSDLSIYLSAYKIKSARRCSWLPAGPGWHKHPLCKWAEEEANYEWLLDLLRELCIEWKIRFGKTHAYSRHSDFYKYFYGQHHFFSNQSFLNHTVFKQDQESLFAIYKKYLYWKWKTQDKHPPKWTNREPPTWYTNPTPYIVSGLSYIPKKK